MRLRTDSTIPIWEYVFVIVGIFIFANTFREVEVIDRYWNYLRILFYGFIALVVALRLRHFVPTTIKATSIMLMTFLTVLSYLWSESPNATLTRSFALIMMTVFAIYFAGRFPLGTQIKVLAITLTLFAVISVLFVFLMPSYGTMGSAWQGIFTQKNVFGRIMVIAAIVALAYPVKTPTGARRKFFAYIALVVLIVLAESMTSLIILFSVTMLFFSVPVLRMKPVPAIAFFLAMSIPIMVTTYLVATIDTDQVLIALGKDPTLTGRAEVWENLDLAIQDRPYIGYGYGAFFNQWNGTYGEFFSEGAAWAPGSAHHNYRDVWLNVGIFGVILFIISNVILIVRSFFLIIKTDSTDAIYPLMMMVYFVILSFSESFALYTEVFWMIYMVIAFSLADALEGKTSKAPVEQESITVPMTTPQFALSSMD